MPSSQESSQQPDWLPIIGRAMALLCLDAEELRSAPLVDQWFLLERLGVPRDEAAAILGTSTESLRVSVHQRKAKSAKKAAPR